MLCFFFLGRGKKKKRWDLSKIEERGKKKKEREETNSRVLHKSYCKEVLIFVIYLFIYFWVLLYWCKQENVNADRSACSAFFFAVLLTSGRCRAQHFLLMGCLSHFFTCVALSFFFFCAFCFLVYPIMLLCPVCDILFCSGIENRREQLCFFFFC